MKPAEPSEQITPDIERCAVRGEEPESSDGGSHYSLKSQCGHLPRSLSGELTSWRIGQFIGFTSSLMPFPSGTAQEDPNTDTGERLRRLKVRFHREISGERRLPNPLPSPSSRDGLERF